MVVEEKVSTKVHLNASNANASNQAFFAVPGPQIYNYEFDVVVTMTKPEYHNGSDCSENKLEPSRVCAYVKSPTQKSVYRLRCSTVIKGRYVAIVMREIPNMLRKLRVCYFTVIEDEGTE